MKKFLAVTLVVLMFIVLVGCDENFPSSGISNLDDINNGNPGITVNEIKFERVNFEQLSQEIKLVIEESKSERGYKLISDAKSEYYYLAVFSGEKNSGGYDIKIDKVVDNEGITNVMVTETSPSKDDMVTMAITYPMDIIKLTGITDNIKLVYLYENETKTVTNPNQAIHKVEAIYVEGKYVGQIDNNSIEVMVDDQPLVFRLDDVTRQQLSEFDEGDIIGIYYIKNEHGQNISVSFKNI